MRTFKAGVPGGPLGWVGTRTMPLLRGPLSANPGPIGAGVHERNCRVVMKMGEPFTGVINVDVRDSVPGRTPSEPPQAPEGAPKVVYIVSMTWASRR